MNAAVCNISWETTGSYIYNGTTQRPTYTYESNGLAFVPTMTMTKNDVVTTSSVNVGTYKMTLTSNNSNITLSGETEKEFTIQKATVTIAWTGEDTFVYDGRTHVPTYTVTTNNGLDVSSDLSLSIYRNDTLVTSALAVGEYCAKITLSNANYELLTTDFTFYIEASVE